MHAIELEWRGDDAVMLELEAAASWAAGSPGPGLVEGIE